MHPPSLFPIPGDEGEGQQGRDTQEHGKGGRLRTAWPIWVDHYPTSVDAWGWTQAEHRYWDDNQEEGLRMNDLKEGEVN
jgi:hypothetical protein